MPHFNPRLDVLGEGPFQRLGSLFEDIIPAANREPVVMSIGEPRHPYPDFVGTVLDANRHLYDRYPPTNGTAEFRTAVAGWLSRRYHLPDGMIDADRHVVPLAGTREGLFLLASLVIPETKAGKRPMVLIPNPFYHCYAGAALAAGAEPYYVPATSETGFLPDFSTVPETVLARTSLVYLCSPANPQGAVASLDYFAGLLALAHAHDFVVAIDECYAEIYHREPPPGVLEACARGGSDITGVMAFHSLSKRSSVPGLRSGFATGDPDIVARFLTLRSYGCASTPLPVYAAAAALWRDESHVEENRVRYREKFDDAEAALAGRLGFYRPPGAFFLWLDVGDGEAAARELWARAAIRTLPGKYLTGDRADADNPGERYLRVALILDRATTAAAVEEIARVL